MDAMSDDPADMPLPIVGKDHDEMLESNPEIANATPETPIGVATLFWQALGDHVHYRNALETMSVNPADWGDYSEAAAALAHLSIMTFVEDNPDRDDIKYVKFIEVAAGGQAFEEAPLHDFWSITVVKPEESPWWLVWGYTHNAFPGTERIVG